MATVTEIYRQVLGRDPDPAGLANWTAAFGSTVDPTELAQFQLAAQPELAVTGFTPATASSQGAAFTGFERTPAMPSGPASPEMPVVLNQTPTVEQLYNMYLARDPSSAEVANWTAAFGSTVDPNEVRQFEAAAQPELAFKSERERKAIADARLSADGGMLGVSPPPTTPTQPITGEVGQYGYENKAPVLNATVAKNLLGNEFAVKADIGPSNELGWATNSKYQGEILTGAGLYGIRGSSEEIQKILAAGENFRQLQAQGKVITTTDPETNTVNYSVQTGIDPETGSPSYVNYANLFNTSGDPEDNNGIQNASKFQDITAKLQSAASQLNIPTTGKNSIQLLNDINAADKRVAVVGRTQSWDPAQTGGVGGQQGPQHAAVVYQQIGDKLVPAAPVQTFNFQDPNTTRGFFGDIFSSVAELVSIPPIAMALSAFGAPFISSQLAALVPALANNPVALDAISKGLIGGVTTGAITGDVEKAAIGALLTGGGSYAVGSGAIGDVLDKVGLGDFRTQLNIPTTAQVSTNIPGIAGFGAAADQVGGALSGVTPGIPVSPGGPTTITPIASSTPGTGLFGAPTGPAGFAGIDLSTQLANQATGGLTAGVTPPLNTGGFGTALPSVPSLTQSLINAGFSSGTAANLAGATLAGVGGVGSAVSGLLGTGGAITGGLGAGAVTTLPSLGGGGGTPAGGGGTTSGGGGGTPAAGGGVTGGIPGIGGLGGLLSGLGNLGNLNLGGLVGAGIDLAQLQALQREATGLGRELAGEAATIGRQGAIPFTPYTVTTGAGVGTVGPGGATAVTSPEMQALRQQQLGLAGQAFGAVNPAQAAQTLYGQVEALAAPGRAREQEALLAGLQQRGLTGFGQNLPTVGGGIRTVNPLMESLLSAQETARAQQALQAQQFGTQEATRQAALGQGLVSGAQGIDQQALAALTAASNLGQQERAVASRNALLQAESALQGLRMRAPYEQIGLQARATGLAGLGGATRGLFGLPTQTGNVLGNLSLGQLFGGTNGTSPLGQGTGPQYGYQDYGIFF